MWECPNCKESMNDCDDYCWNCRRPNPSLKAAPPAAAAAPAMVEAKAVNAAPAPAVSRRGIRISEKAIIAALVSVLIVALALGAFIHRGRLPKLVGAGDRPAPVVTGQDGVEREVAYEEIFEYDGKGNVSKTLKTYPASVKKSK